MRGGRAAFLCVYLQYHSTQSCAFVHSCTNERALRSNACWSASTHKRITNKARASAHKRTHALTHVRASARKRTHLCLLSVCKHRNTYARSFCAIRFRAHQRAYVSSSFVCASAHTGTRYSQCAHVCAQVRHALLIRTSITEIGARTRSLHARVRASTRAWSYHTRTRARSFRANTHAHSYHTAAHPRK